MTEPIDVIAEALGAYADRHLRASEIVDALKAAGYVIEPDWQLIETAPDPERVLRAAFWLPECYDLPATPVIGYWSAKLGDWATVKKFRSAPTHWRPLPTPPK